MNYFEKADPRPYGLKGQLVLHDAKISQLEGNILSIEIGEKNRMLRFEDRTDLVKWKAVFDKDKDLIEELYLTIYSRFPSEEEVSTAAKYFTDIIISTALGNHFRNTVDIRRAHNTCVVGVTPELA